MSRPSFSPAHQPYNIILAGSFGVGKSSLFNMLSGEVHADYQFSSVTGKQDASRSPSQHFGKWCHTALVNGDTVKVTLWDTGDLERSGIRNVTRSYFRYAVGVALVYDIGNRETLDALYDWVFRLRDSVGWQWENSLCLAMWGNNRDQDLNSVSEEQLTAFLDHVGLREEDCYQVDAYNGCNVCESYQALIARIHTQLGSCPAPPVPEGHNITLDRHTPGDTERGEETCSC